MMNGLEVPHALARLRFNANEALSKEPRSGTMPAVRVVCGTRDGHIDVVELRVIRHAGPHIRVSAVFRRSFVPRVVPVLAIVRDRVEGPEQLARADIERL